MIAEINTLLATGLSIGEVYNLLVSVYPDIVDIYCRHTHMRVEELKRDLESVH